MKDMMNVKDAAKSLKLSECRVRQLLAARELMGEKITERGWAIPLEFIQALKQRREAAAKLKAAAKREAARKKKRKH
jgi:hypothetical protein